MASFPKKGYTYWDFESAMRGRAHAASPAILCWARSSPRMVLRLRSGGVSSGKCGRRVAHSSEWLRDES